MTKKRKHKQTKAELEAGQKNLAKWHEQNPGRQQALKHGAWSQHIRERYSDERTTEGRRLKDTMQALMADLGGQENISAAQRLLLGSIRSKLIVLWQIGDYADRQESLVNSEGELLPCLGRSYTTYAESLRRDLEALLSVKKRSKIPKLDEYLQETYGKDKS